MKHAKVWALVLTALAAFLLPSLLLLQPETTHSFVYALGACVVLWAEMKMFAVDDRRLRRYALWFGWAFAFFQLAGWRLDAAETLGGLVPAVLLVISSAALAPAAGYGFVLVVRAADKLRLRNEEPTQSKKVFWLSFGFILLCWLPVFLAYYPGMFNFDAGRQIEQLLSGIYDGTLPLLHSVILGAFYTFGGMIGSYNAGLALYTIVQCAAVAAAMAYAAQYLYHLRLPCWTWLGMNLVHALLPMHSMMVISTTKDLFFCSALLVLMIRLHALWTEPKKWLKLSQWLSIVLLTAAMCLLRNNGAFAAGAVFVLAFFLLLKNRALMVRVLSALMAGVMLMAVCTVGLNKIYQPPRTGIREWLSIPLSQVARVYDEAVNDERELKEATEIEAFIPDVDRYQRHLSDGIKRHTTVGVVNMPQYLSLWGRLFMQYPADFFDAAAYLTKGYWHLDDETHLDIYAERGDHGYLETKAPDGLGVTRDSKLPGLMKKLDELFVQNDYRKIPVLATVVEPAFWCWMAALVVVLAMYRRDRGTILCSMLLAGLFASMLFGPCAYIRYAYPLAICALPLLGMCLSHKTE